MKLMMNVIRRLFHLSDVQPSGQRSSSLISFLFFPSFSFPAQPPDDSQHNLHLLSGGSGLVREGRIEEKRKKTKGERTRDLKDTNKSLMVLSPLLSFLFSYSIFLLLFYFSLLQLILFGHGRQSFSRQSPTKMISCNKGIKANRKRRCNKIKGTKKKEDIGRQACDSKFFFFIPLFYCSFFFLLPFPHGCPINNNISFIYLLSRGMERKGNRKRKK